MLAMPAARGLATTRASLMLLILVTGAPAVAGEREEASELSLGSTIEKDSKKTAVGTSVLGYQAGDMIFGKYRLLKLLTPGRPRGASPPQPGRRPPAEVGDVVRHRESLEAKGAEALLELQPDPIVEWPGDGVVKGVNKYTYVGAGQFGEAWKVEDDRGDIKVIKFLYGKVNEENVHLSLDNLKPDMGCKLEADISCAMSVMMAARECQILKYIGGAAQDPKLAVFADNVMKCEQFSLDGLPQDLWTKNAADGEAAVNSFIEDKQGTSPIYSSPIYSLLEFCGDIQLQEAVKFNNIWSLKKAQKATRDIAGALALLHSLHIMHRDVRTANIMVKDPTDSPTFKLINFGLSEQLIPSKWDAWVDSAYVGIPVYVSPQLACLGWNEPIPLDYQGNIIFDDGKIVEQTCKEYGNFTTYVKVINNRDPQSYKTFSSANARPGGSDDVFALGVAIVEMLATNMDGRSLGLTPYDVAKQWAKEKFGTDTTAAAMATYEFNDFTPDELGRLIENLQSRFGLAAEEGAQPLLKVAQTALSQYPVARTSKEALAERLALLELS